MTIDREELNAGLIGAGLLGSAVARRWLSSGRRVVVFDLDSGRLEALADAGAERALTVQEVFERCGRIGLALPHSAISRQVLADVDPRRIRTLVLDMTTGDPDEMAGIARECASKEIIYLDTTVGGSSAQVSAGDAIVMAGGEAAALDSCRDLLELFAKRIFWLGPAGNGARMKLVLNLVLGLHRAVLAEGLAFAESCGLDAELALEILRSGPAYSKVIDSKGDKMLRGDFSPQARLAQHRKDVDLILQESARHLACTPLSELHRRLLVDLEQAGFGGEDNSAIIRAFRKPRGPA
jgi:3-hydroxyisobutyrate dehydrogenase-like beta-hydroxyacid dehydrogenase